MTLTETDQGWTKNKILRLIQDIKSPLRLCQNVHGLMLPNAGWGNVQLSTHVASSSARHFSLFGRDAVHFSIALVRLAPPSFRAVDTQHKVAYRGRVHASHFLPIEPRS